MRPVLDTDRDTTVLLTYAAQTADNPCLGFT
jgi:hypothetical protein